VKENCCYKFTELHHLTVASDNLGPIAPLQFGVELGSNGRRELVHGDCVLHHFKINTLALNSRLNLNRRF